MPGAGAHDRSDPADHRPEAGTIFQAGSVVEQGGDRIHPGWPCARSPAAQASAITRKPPGADRNRPGEMAAGSRQLPNAESDGATPPMERTTAVGAAACRPPNTSTTAAAEGQWPAI